MTKFIAITSCCLTALLLSCGKNIQLQEATQPPPIDSFTVSGIDAEQQTGNFQYINDSTLCSYDLTNMTLVFFHKGVNGNYRAGIRKEIDTKFWSMYFRGDDGKHYFTDTDNTITEYNTSADSLLKRYTIPHRFSYLKDSFVLALANNMPVLKIHDTIIAVISPNSNESERLYYKEQEVSEFRIDPATNTLHYLRSYIDKPSNLPDYNFPQGMYCLHNNTVFLVYPPVDTIYCFNRSTATLLKTAIRNQDFVQPATFPCTLYTPEYNSCATNYYLHNFRYDGIYFNPITKHFVLLYNAPVVPVKGHIPSFSDQPLKAIVLDEQLNVVGYHYFKKRLEAGISYFVIPGKGLAMPLSDERYETTRFYIYNL